MLEVTICVRDCVKLAVEPPLGVGVTLCDVDFDDVCVTPGVEVMLDVCVALAVASCEGEMVPLGVNNSLAEQVPLGD